MAGCSYNPAFERRAQFTIRSRQGEHALASSAAALRGDNDFNQTAFLQAVVDA